MLIAPQNEIWYFLRCQLQRHPQPNECNLCMHNHAWLMRACITADRPQTLCSLFPLVGTTEQRTTRKSDAGRAPFHWPSLWLTVERAVRPYELCSKLHTPACTLHCTFWFSSIKQMYPRRQSLCLFSCRFFFSFFNFAKLTTGLTSCKHVLDQHGPTVQRNK